MTDAELRAMVRSAVARHLGSATPPAPVAVVPVTPARPTSAAPSTSATWQHHASHHLYVALANIDGSCVIEPSVQCDHCGFCKSHGH